MALGILARTRSPMIALTLAFGVLVACSGVDGLSGAAPDLSAAERDTVRGQVDKALAEKRFNVAWNQEVAAGADRDRLGDIAVQALAARSGHAEGMFKALRERHGALAPKARAEVSRLSRAAREANAWARALFMELESADDPPAYTAAWAVYREAPVDQADDLLETITAARADHKESAD